eukprot:superscaffoldBa00000162_g2304
MAEKGKMDIEHLGGVVRMREEHEKVVKDCESRIQHWKKVSGDYEALKDRLTTLPDQLSYDIMVPFGPLAFMPGKLVHTNEVTVLLGDNWFSKCSAKQAQKIVDHRMNFDALTGGAPDRHGNKGPLLLLAFSGTVVEKDPMPSAVPHLTIAPPALPTILERKQEEVMPDVTPPQQPPKRVSKFKAARLQQK